MNKHWNLQTDMVKLNAHSNDNIHPMKTINVGFFMHSEKYL